MFSLTFLHFGRAVYPSAVYTVPARSPGGIAGGFLLDKQAAGVDERRQSRGDHGRKMPSGKQKMRWLCALLGKHRMRIVSSQLEVCSLVPGEEHPQLAGCQRARLEGTPKDPLLQPV